MYLMIKLLPDIHKDFPNVARNSAIALLDHKGLHYEKIIATVAEKIDSLGEDKRADIFKAIELEADDPPMPAKSVHVLAQIKLRARLERLSYDEAIAIRPEWIYITNVLCPQAQEIVY